MELSPEKAGGGKEGRQGVSKLVVLLYSLVAQSWWKQGGGGRLRRLSQQRQVGRGRKGREANRQLVNGNL